MTTKKLSQRCRYPQKFYQNVEEFWIHAQGFLGPIFLNRDESLVRLAKAFAGKDMCLAFGYE
jgi:hypothetical protein